MTEFKLPEVGENVEQGDLVRLMIAPGATVSEGQPVMELETDKAVVEVPSSVSGQVKDVLVKQGEKIKVGQVIFTVENGAGGKRAETQATSIPSKSEKQSAPASTSPPAPSRNAYPYRAATRAEGAVSSVENGPKTSGTLSEPISVW